MLWMRARRRAAAHSPSGVAASDEIPAGYFTLTSLAPVRGSSLTNVSGAPWPGVITTQTASFAIATDEGWEIAIGLPFGRPVRGSSRTRRFDSVSGIHSEPKPNAPSEAPTPIFGASGRISPDFLETDLQAVLAARADEDVVAEDADDIGAFADRDLADDPRSVLISGAIGGDAGVSIVAEPERDRPAHAHRHGRDQCGTR